METDERLTSSEDKFVIHSPEVRAISEAELPNAITANEIDSVTDHQTQREGVNGQLLDNYSKLVDNQSIVLENNYPLVTTGQNSSGNVVGMNMKNHSPESDVTSKENTNNEQNSKIDGIISGDSNEFNTTKHNSGIENHNIGILDNADDIPSSTMVINNEQNSSLIMKDDNAAITGTVLNGNGDDIKTETGITSCNESMVDSDILNSNGDKNSPNFDSNVMTEAIQLSASNGGVMSSTDTLSSSAETVMSSTDNMMSSGDTMISSGEDDGTSKEMSGSKIKSTDDEIGTPLDNAETIKVDNEHDNGDVNASTSLQSDTVLENCSGSDDPVKGAPTEDDKINSNDVPHDTSIDEHDGPSTDVHSVTSSDMDMAEYDIMYDEDMEEDLGTLSLRIAQKSQDSSSQLYRLVNVPEAEGEGYVTSDGEFTPPVLQNVIRGVKVMDTGSDETQQEVEDPEIEVKVTGSEDPDSSENNQIIEENKDRIEDHDVDVVITEDIPSANQDINETIKSVNIDINDDNNGAISNVIQPKPSAELTFVPPHVDTPIARTQVTPQIPTGVQNTKPFGFDGKTPFLFLGLSGRRSESWKRRIHNRQPRTQEYQSWEYTPEDEEENFVLSALFRAVDDGNLDGLKEVLEEATNFNINQCNKKGETLLHNAASSGHIHIIKFLQDKGLQLDACDRHGDSSLYWAARQGHLEVIKYLKEQDVCLNTQNKAGEAPIHVAARYGHTEILEYLCQSGADVNLQDKLGETALHTVAWHGLPAEICAMLCAAGCKVDTRNKENETPLHCAASRGHLECVRVLLSHGASLNVQDKRQNTPLHLACRRRYVTIGLLLLHAGCGFDILDCINETALHPASKEGLLPIVQTMCAYGCQVDLINKGGLSALHLAGRGGHTEVVRCLLLSGAEPDIPNKDGVNAEIMALAQGHQEVAELLSKLKPERREICIRQLIPTNVPLNRIKVKVFGSSGVGKTTLIDSLKCGYLSSFFRKARVNNSASTHSVKPKGTESNGSIHKQNSLPTQLSYDTVHESYTHGIDVQQVTVSGGPGDLSIWEFSGYEPYYVMYDHFIGDPNCVHMIVFSLQDTQDVQLSQVLFWLNFIKSRIAPMEPVGPGGRLPWPARVLLVGTHADKAECIKNHRGELECVDANVLLATVRHKFESDLYIQTQLFVLDGHLAMSPEIKALRNRLTEMKAQIVQFLPMSNGFMDACVASLSTWRKALSDYPVVTWPIFMEYIRTKVNLLASEEHLKELMCQLQLLGEVIYIETDNEQDLVVLNAKWLCSDVIGHLLSHEQLRHSRPTGCFSIDDFQLLCPETDARDMLIILEALELCTRCEVDSEVEYEFPCLNFVETIPGLWEKDDPRVQEPVYGGVRIQCPRGMNNQLLHMFPRIQTHLRRDMLSEHSRADSDLYQWYHGSKLCSGSMECLITLEQSEQVIEIKCRAPEELRTSLYYFQEDVCDIVLDVIEDSCPGICLEKYILRSSQLKEHKHSVHAYAPKDILSAQLEGQTHITVDENTREEFIDLIGFGSEEIWNNITPGIDLHAHYLSIHARRRISMLLDPPDPMGRDWCLLAVSLGLTQDLPEVDQNDKQMVRSKTDSIIDMWSRAPDSTIASLIRKLKDLGRQDAADALLTNCPLYHVFQDDHSQEEKSHNQPHAYSSENTLSSSNVSR